MAVVTTNLGAVTAYADAVAGGYTGTKAEWQALMASYGSVAEQAAESASQAAESASTASTKATEATTAAGTASTAKDGAVAAQTAAETAQDKAEDAQGAAEEAAQSVSASAAQITQNTTDISELKSGFSEVKGNLNHLHDTVLDYKELTFMPSTYIRNDVAVGGTVTTTQVASGSYSSLICPCVKGQRFLLTVNGGSAARGYSFVDGNSKQVEVAPADTNYTNELLEAPTDGYLLVNNKTTLPNPLVKAEYNKIEEDVEELKRYENEIFIRENLLETVTVTDGLYYSNGYGNTASIGSCSIYDTIYLEPNKTYTIRSPYLDFTWIKKGASVGVLIKSLDNYINNGDGTHTFTTWDTTDTIKLFITIATANKGVAYLAEGAVIPSTAKESGFVYIPRLSQPETNANILYVNKSYTSSVSGWGVTKFNSVINAINSITDSSESNPYVILITAGTTSNPVVFDDWNTVYGGHVSGSASYVGVQIPSYVTITTDNPTHPDRTVLYFDGHAGISDTMTYDDAYKKALFHINGRKMGITVEGVTLRSKDCRYAFHPESGTDGYLVDWTLKNCVIDWQGCPHSSETGWAGVTAVGVGLGYGGKGHFENCKWLTVSGVTTAIGGHTNGWNPGVSALPIMPGATITMKNCDFGGYNVFMSNSTNTNELNNVLDFYNVVNCSGNNSTGWVEILKATSFNT